MKSALKDYFKLNHPNIDLTDFTTYERSCAHTLRFELGEDLDNGTPERVTQAKERALKIVTSCFERDSELFIVTYEWDGEEDPLARTPNYLYETLKVSRSEEKQKLSLMYFDGEEQEYEDGYLSIYKLQKKSIDFEMLLEGIANMDMGFNPSIHQLVFFFGATSNKLFWMYDDRGCLIGAQNLNDLTPDFDSFKSWLFEGYEERYLSASL